MSNLSYNEKYNIMTNRVIFADYIARKELNAQGNPLALNMGQPNNEASIFTAIRDGQVHTTGDELAAYLNQAALSGPPRVPDPPTNLCVIPNDSALTIIFIAGFNGNLPITEYKYSTDGTTYTTVNYSGNSLTITGLTNGEVYTITLKAVNSKGLSAASSSVSAAPIPDTFNPSMISGIKLWLDAQVISNVILTDGRVTGWNDSAESNNFTANATGIINYPLPGINSRPSLDFTTAIPTATYLQNASLNLSPTNTLTLFMVLAQTATGAGNSELFYTRNDYTYFDLFNNTNTTGELSLNARNTTQRSTGSNIVNSTNNIISVILDTSGSIFLNGSTTNVASTAFAGLSLNTPLRWAISGGAFKGYVGEVITYPSVLITASRQKIEGYLAWKWGIQGSLPVGHPYKTAPPA